MTLLGDLRARAGVPVDDLRGLVLAISRMPYGRPPARTPQAVLAAWRGTCSGKHLLLRAVVPEIDPALAVDLVHRVYTVDPATAGRLWGPGVAAHVPAGGFVDVHTYAVVTPPGVPVDVTFPLDGWDGATPVPLACGPGTDVPAGDDPAATKDALVARHCDPAVREPFIAALTALTTPAGPGREGAGNVPGPEEAT